MSNSPLVSYTKLSPNKYNGRSYNRKKYNIDTITIHCVVGQCTVQSLGDQFASPSRKASSSYGIGRDGKIGLYVNESDTSKCSSSRANDVRAITIEVASDTTHPYAITDAAYEAIINLCEDICRRNGIAELRWKGDKSLIGKPDKQNMTVHRWFANKACPGDYIYNRLGAIASEVNRRLGKTQSSSQSPVEKPSVIKLPACPFRAIVKVTDLNIRGGPSTKHEIKSVCPKGTFTIVAVDGDWGKLSSGAGWIYITNSNWVKIENNQNGVGNDAKSFVVQVDRDDLNIRSGPGINYGKFSSKIQRGIYTIIQTESGQGSKSGWGKLKSGQGWISLDYVKRI